MTGTSPRECVANALIHSGHDEAAAAAALAGIVQYLRHRIFELRAEGCDKDAAWYQRVLNEMTP